MAEFYRVVIDVRRIQTNLFEQEGGRLTEPEIRSWLRSVGFVPAGKGRIWLASGDVLRSLDDTELLAVYPFEPAVATGTCADRQ